MSGSLVKTFESNGYFEYINTCDERSSFLLNDGSDNYSLWGWNGEDFVSILDGHDVNYYVNDYVSWDD